LTFVKSAVLNLNSTFLCLAENCPKPKMIRLTDILYYKLKSTNGQNRL